MSQLTSEQTQGHPSCHALNSLCWGCPRRSAQRLLSRVARLPAPSKLFLRVHSPKLGLISFILLQADTLEFLKIFQINYKNLKIWIFWNLFGKFQKKYFFEIFPNKFQNISKFQNFRFFENFPNMDIDSFSSLNLTFTTLFGGWGLKFLNSTVPSAQRNT